MQVTHREQCPRCASLGKDKNGDNLVFYDDGHAHCFSCGYTIHSEGYVSSSSGGNRVELKTLETVAINSRGISEEVASRYGVGIDENDSLCFPYPKNGYVSAYKCRRIDANGLTRDFRWSGDSSGIWWFGRNVCPNNASTLILTEGETDTLSIAEAFRFESRPPCVMGLAKGAASAQSAVRAELEYIRTFKRIIVLFDSDEAGQDAAESILPILPMGRVYIGSYPTGNKDANETLMNMGEKALQGIVHDAVRVTPKSIVKSSELVRDSLDFFFNRDAILGKSTGYPGLDSVLGGWGEGTVITLVGDTGTGKTTFATQLAYNAAKPGHKVFWIPLEMTPRHQALKFAEFETQLPLLSEIDDPLVTPKQLQDALVKVNENVVFFNHYGSLDKDTLREAIEVAVDGEGCKLIVLDHISAAVTGENGMDWKAIDATISLLKEVALQKRVAILCLAHVTVGKQEDKNGATKLTLGHIRGSRGIGQYSDAVIGLERDRKSSEIILRTLKLHRLIGRYGEIVYTYTGGFYEELGTLDEDGMPQPVEPRQRKQLEDTELDYAETKTETKRFRKRLPPQTSESELRTETSGDGDTDTLHTGLHRSEKQSRFRRKPQSDTGREDTTTQSGVSNRDEGLLSRQRPDEIEKVSTTVRGDSGSNRRVSKWQWDSL